MSEVVCTAQQNGVADQAYHWYQELRQIKQRFLIDGPAGTGKTTLSKELLKRLGLPVERVAFMTLTNKAALVQRQMNDLPFTTIHSTIYKLRRASSAEIKALKDRIEHLRQAGSSVIDLENTLTALRKPDWQLIPAALDGIDLVVLDEYSMIDKKTAADLESFGKPILLLGDSAQLEAVDGTTGFPYEPDAVLAEIHRQARNSPIIAAATLVREGKRVPYGQTANEFGSVTKLGFSHQGRYTLDPGDMMRFDQIICGSHETRRLLNNEIRLALGLEDTLPVGPDEKILVTKTFKKANLYNGQFVTLANIRPSKNDKTFIADVTDEDGTDCGPLHCYNGDYRDHEEQRRGRKVNLHPEDDDFLRRGHVLQTTFGYCITGYKSQGSQWSNVLVVDDWEWCPKHQRFLYTAVTRAAQNVMILVRNKYKR